MLPGTVHALITTQPREEDPKNLRCATMNTDNTTRDPVKTTVLLIEDQDDVRGVWAALLGIHGFDVLVAADGSEGLRIAAQVRPSLIITDVTMPGMDGLEVCRRLRATQASAAIPIIVWSAAPLTAPIDELANVTLLKPVSVEVLLGHVGKLLESTNKAWR
jgi:CheY-like chemotaxis protein